jgi:Rieske 2Fe-2S family protein
VEAYIRAMFRLEAREIEGVLAPLARATPLPSRAFTDPGSLALERAAIFARTWTCVGREDEVALPGQFLCEDGVAVVRGPDLELRAFHDVCRHRATPLLDTPCGRVREIACPYHGWTYELTGALRHAPDAPEGFDRAAHGLFPVRVACALGFVFVQRGPSAPSLDAWLDVVPPWLVECTPARLSRAHRSTWEVEANWKLLVANFQESHHFPRVHPALERLTPTVRATSWRADGPWLGGVMDLVDDAETVSTTRKRGARPFVAHETRRRQVHDAMLFPTLLTSLQPDYLLTYRLVPRAVDRTRVVADVLVHPEASREVADVIDFWSIVNAEDRAICERQQRGLASPAWRPSVYATVEDGVHAFEGMIARAYAAAGAP